MALLAPTEDSRGFLEALISPPAGRARRVLLVSPHFPPINAPDHHRVRLSLPYLQENGWEAEILAVHPDGVEGTLDPELARSLPKAIVVHWVRPIPARWTRRLGFGNLAWRAYRAIRKRGGELLETGKFDLVFFSTTQFGVLPLGPHWKRRYGLPYVLDFQDEWTGDYYEQHPQVIPPGGRLKHAASRWLARRQEPEVINGSAQIVSVSHAYNHRLKASYPGLREACLHQLPFGAEPFDFDYVSTHDVRQNFFDADDGHEHWAYAGRGGEDLRLVVRAFFCALKRALAQGLVKRDTLRIHFIGTSYAPGELARESLAPLASKFGLEDMVQEWPERVPYFTTLRILKDASALLVFGSDEASYSASKIFPALLARKPLLALFRRESPVVEFFQNVKSGTLVDFSANSSREEIADRIFEKWFAARGFAESPEPDEEALAGRSARAMTRRLTDIFDLALAGTAAVR